MDLPTEVLLLGSLAIAALVVVLIAFAARARPIESAPEPIIEASQPETAQPVESPAAAEPGPSMPKPRPIRKAKASPRSQRERLASAFAEQIEDVLRSSLQADPLLAERDVDLATADDGSLEIIVDGESYAEVSQVPDKRIREALARAVVEWQAGKL
jgi:hypothetical protein